MQYFSRLHFLLLAAMVMFAGWSAFAPTDALSTGRPVLSVSQAAGQNATPVDLDMAALEGLPHYTIATATPWTDGVSRFEGVLMRDLLQHLGVNGTVGTFIALNDYKVQIPVADFANYDVLLAYKRDGSYMPVRDKGPLWIIYPLDQHPELNSEETRSKMIWQVRRVVVE
jgi:hypothetical protein